MENVPSLLTIYNRIKADMETRLTSGSPILQVSFLGVMAMVFAGASHLMYKFIALIPDNLLPDTAPMRWLQRLAIIWGVGIKSASPATGQIIVTGIAGGTIYSGTEFEDENGVGFITTQNYEVAESGTATIAVEAVADGPEGNVDVDALFFISDVTDYFETECPTVAPFTGGSDTETEESLRSRILSRWANRPSSGSIADLEDQCLAVEGVSYAWILPAETYLGAGTAGAVVAGDDKAELDSTSVAVVQAAIDEKQIIGAETTVFSIDPVDLELSVIVTPISDAIEEAIGNSLVNLFISTAAPGAGVKISAIRDAISAVIGPDGDFTIQTITRKSDSLEYDVNQNLPKPVNPSDPDGYGQAYFIDYADITVTEWTNYGT